MIAQNKTPLGGASGAENSKVIYLSRKATMHGAAVINCTACGSHFRENSQSTICPTCSTWSKVILHHNAQRAALAKLSGGV